MKASIVIMGRQSFMTARDVRAVAENTIQRMRYFPPLLISGKVDVIGHLVDLSHGLDNEGFRFVRGVVDIYNPSALPGGIERYKISPEISTGTLYEQGSFINSLRVTTEGRCAGWFIDWVDG